MYIQERTQHYIVLVLSAVSGIYWSWNRIPWIRGDYYTEFQTFESKLEKRTSH